MCGKWQRMLLGRTCDLSMDGGKTSFNHFNETQFTNRVILMKHLNTDSVKFVCEAARLSEQFQMPTGQDPKVIVYMNLTRNDVTEMCLIL